MARRPLTLAEVAAVNLHAAGVGQIKAVVKASTVCVTIFCWYLAADKLGHWPTVEQYARHWRQSERTSYRELALFAQAFPGEDGPRRLVGCIAAQVDEKLQASQVGSLPADLILA